MVAMAPNTHRVATRQAVNGTSTPRVEPVMLGDHDVIGLGAHVRPTGDVEALIRTHRAFDQLLDPGIEIQVDEIAVGHGVERDVDGGDAPVCGDQRAHVEGIGERATAQIGELLGIVRYLLDEVTDLDQIQILVSLDGEGAGQTLHTAHPFEASEGLGEVSQPPQVLAREDVVGRHGDHIDIVGPEVEDRLLIERATRIISQEQGPGRGIDVDVEAWWG